MEDLKNGVYVFEVYDAVMDGKTERVAEILDEFGFTGPRARYIFDISRKFIALTMLKAASADAHQGAFDRELAIELIMRLSSAVQIFEFLETVAESTGLVSSVNAHDFDKIPTDIRKKMKNGNYSGKIAQKIQNLDRETMEALIVFTAGPDNVKGLDRAYSSSFVRNIYANKILPDALLFAYMGLNLRRTMTEEEIASIVFRPDAR